MNARKNKIDKFVDTKKRERRVTSKRDREVSGEVNWILWMAQRERDRDINGGEREKYLFESEFSF